MDPRDVLTRPAARPDAVLRYGEHPDHLLDLHLPPTTGAPAPVVFLLHGGFWRQRYDRTHTRPLAQALAADGWAVVTPEYRRTGGDGGWPRTFDDVAAAFAHLGAVHDVAPDRLLADEVTVLGHSAGGHLALWLTLCADLAAVPRVGRVVALAPVADLHEAHRRRLGDGAVEALMGGTPQARPREYAQADAATRLPADVDIRVLHGDRDRQVPVQLSRRLPGVSYVELPDADHYALIDPLSSAWAAVRAALSR